MPKPLEQSRCDDVGSEPASTGTASYLTQEGGGPMPERHGEQIVATTTEARQGVTGHNVRYVLIWGTVGVIFVFVIAYVLFFR